MNITSFRPDGTISEKIFDHGDGTGTVTTYDPDGTVVETMHLSGLPVGDPIDDLIDAAELIAAARADVAAATSIAQLRTRTLALDELRARLA